MKCTRDRNYTFGIYRPDRQVGKMLRVIKTYQLTIVFALIVCLVNIRTVSPTSGVSVEIRTAVGSAVHFPLPTFEECGSYNLTDTAKNLVVSVRSNFENISSLYSNRSTSTRLPNGTVLFTLHHLVDSDFVKYLVNPIATASEACWIQYSLTKETDDKYSDTAYWLSWEPWSSCQATCGYGKRSRTRSCSIPRMCRGELEETSDCVTGIHCDTFEWSNWSAWSSCTITCGSGDRTRYRNCMSNNVQQTDISKCVGNVIDRGLCSKPSCDLGVRTQLLATQEVTSLYQWTSWSMWSTCSESCGTGVQSRARKCQYSQRIIDVRYCAGNSYQNETCTPLCDGDTSIKDEVVELPLSAIIGAGSVLFIIILFVVICVLVLKLRQKRTRTIPVFVEPQTQLRTGSNRPNGRAKSSIVSFTSFEVSDAYATINDDDVKSRDRQSVLTVDNPYVALPLTPEDKNPYSNDAVMYNNTHESVFMFDKTSGTGRKVSNAYQNSGATGNQANVPRHMSVDSVGYLMPGSAADRAIKRTKKYKH